MDPSKVYDVLNWPTSKSLRVVRGFLGLTGYYRWFIRNYGVLACQTLNLAAQERRSRKIAGTFETQTTFEKLKQALTTSLVLTIPNFSKKFMLELERDASRLGIDTLF